MNHATNTERVAFEAHAMTMGLTLPLARGVPPQDPEGYRHWATHAAWLTWQAARATQASAEPVDLSVPAMNPCGGCGNAIPDERCIGCGHIFIPRRAAAPSSAPSTEPIPAHRLALNVRHPDCHKAADAFWTYWKENGETHKHGYYESTWGAINRAIRMVGVVEHDYFPGPDKFPERAPSIDSAGWIAVADRLPQVGVGVMVYSPPLQGEGPEDYRLDFDCIDPNDDDHASWLNHNENYEHYCCVAKPEGSTGPRAEAPYTHWMPLPTPPAAMQPQGAGGQDA